MAYFSKRSGHGSINMSKIIARMGFEPVTLGLNKNNTNTAPLSQQGIVDLVVIFGLLTYIGKKKMQ